MIELFLLILVFSSYILTQKKPSGKIRKAFDKTDNDYFVASRIS